MISWHWIHGGSITVGGISRTHDWVHGEEISFWWNALGYVIWNRVCCKRVNAFDDWFVLKHTLTCSENDEMAESCARLCRVDLTSSLHCDWIHRGRNNGWRLNRSLNLSIQWDGGTLGPRWALNRTGQDTDYVEFSSSNIVKLRLTYYKLHTVEVHIYFSNTHQQSQTHAGTHTYTHTRAHAHTHTQHTYTRTRAHTHTQMHALMQIWFTGESH